MYLKSLFLLLVALNVPVYGKSENCVCMDEPRGNPFQNTLSFKATTTICPTLLETFSLKKAVTGSGTCQINGTGTNYPCTYSFTKVRTTECDPT